MDTALTVVEPAALPAVLTATLKLAADFAQASKAPATQAAYGSDFRIFEAWCATRGMSALPATAAALCGFLADEAVTVEMLVKLIRNGLASAHAERMIAGGRAMELARMKITEAGRQALVERRGGTHGNG
jgi:hypothetical protein